MGTFTQDRYTRIYDYLAKLKGCRFGEEYDSGRAYSVGPRWLSNDAEAFQLMSTALRGYYETREGTSEHCIVIGHDYGEAVVVRLAGHGTKTRALRYAIAVAVATIARARLQKLIDEIAAPDVYQQAVLRPNARPKHDWLAWFTKPVETKTVYRGAYPEAMHAELANLTVRPLAAVDVPALEWTDKLAGALLREDGAILHPKHGSPEIGSLDDGGGITWILVPAVPVDER
jgi:pimeloyl-ACP methyl ester carboxylesterase